MIGIIDYGVGNLFSLRSSCACIGQEAFVSGDPSLLAKADRLILPGVGAFEDAAKKLRESGMAEFVREQAAQGKPLLGICLGQAFQAALGNQRGITRHGSFLLPMHEALILSALAISGRSSLS